VLTLVLERCKLVTTVSRRRRVRAVQILLCVVCPLLIPWLITFDSSTGVPLFHNRVAPLSKKDADRQERLVTRTRRRLCRVCTWFCCCRLVTLLFYTARLFYKAPVVKFCCHTVPPTLHHIGPTRLCNFPGSINRVPALAEVKGGNVTSAGWQVTLRDCL